MSLLLALVLLLVASPAWGAIAFVQKSECSFSGATSCTTPAITSTTGNLFVANAVLYDGTFTSVTDSKSNTYVGTGVSSGINIQDVRQRYVANATGGGSHTFTLTTSGSIAAFSTVEISGATTTPLDQAKAGNDSGTSHTTGATATTTQAAELFVGAAGLIGGATFATDTGAGWVERTNIPPSGGFVALLVGTKVVAATGTYAYTFTTSASVGTDQVISTWKELAAAAGARQRCVGCGADSKVIE